MAMSAIIICNLALNRVGEEQITALTDDSKPARQCNLIYAPARDALLRAYPWNFAMARSELAQLATTPDFEFDYEYQLPNDCLRVWTLYDDAGDYVIEGRKLLTNDDEVYLKYIKKETDPTKFDAAFVTALYLRMAVQLAEVLASDTAMQKEIKDEYMFAIREAYRLDAIEGTLLDETIEDTSWQEAGR